MSEATSFTVRSQVQGDATDAEKAFLIATEREAQLARERMQA